MSGSNSSNPDSVAPEPTAPTLASLAAPRGGVSRLGSGPAPAEALAFTVHSLPVPELPDDRRTRIGRLKMLFVLVVCAAPVAASYFTYFVIRPRGEAAHATLMQPARPLPPALTLTTPGGQPVDPASLQGQWLIVVVGGGACDAGCEQRLYLQRQLREMTGRERERIDKLWLVDDAAPLRPELLAALRAAPATTVLRAPRAALERWLEPAAGGTLDAHLYIVDPMGRWMMRAPAVPEPRQLKRDLERLLRASASWDRPGR